MEALDEKIIEELKIFKFKRNSLSYEYLIDAIKIVSKQKTTIKDFLHYVYRPISEKYNTKPDNVQWCLIKLINLMYYNTEEEIIDNYFNINKDEKLTAKQFIIGISRKIDYNKDNI